MEGEFPSKAKAMVKEFILKYRDELNQMWGTEKVVKLPPLDRFILRLSDEGSDTVFHKAVKVKFLDGTAMEGLTDSFSDYLMKEVIPCFIRL